MPRPRDLEDVELKFDDCAECVFAGRVRPCRSCDVGEHFKELEPAGVDDLIKERGAW